MENPEKTIAALPDQIGDDVIDMVAELSQLSLEGAEKEEARKALLQELTFIERLGELPPEDTGDAFFASGSSDPVLREDETAGEDLSERILENAPRLERQCYLVPRTIGESS